MPVIFTSGDANSVAKDGVTVAAPIVVSCSLFFFVALIINRLGSMQKCNELNQNFELYTKSHVTLYNNLTTLSLIN